MATHARLVSVWVEPSRVDETVALFKETNARSLAQQPGFEQVYYLMNRATGKVTSVTFWASEDDERRSRANIPSLIENMAHLLTAQEVHQETLEIVHLRQASR
jgi:hypothetical protein